MMSDKALAPGTVIRGGKYSYKVESLLRSDGQGYTYKTVATVGSRVHEKNVYMVVREHMMSYCSQRGDDGVEVVTPDDIAPTVASCLKAFERVSLERAKVAAECPWLISVIETFPANNTYYYVVEFLDGQTFGEYIQANGGRLTYEQARVILGPVFDAVHTLHNHHVLHTDIHPGHIRIVKKGRGFAPVLFSLYSTLHFGDKGLQEWSLPAMNCKVGYAPPEQYGHMDHFYPQTDVYALAATLVYALSGRSLPDSRSITAQTVRAILPPTLPETLVSAIVSALNPDLLQRTSSVTDFREELLEFRRSYCDSDSRSDFETTEAEDAPRHPGGVMARIRRLAERVLGLFR